MADIQGGLLPFEEFEEEKTIHNLYSSWLGLYFCCKPVARNCENNF